MNPEQPSVWREEGNVALSNGHDMNADANDGPALNLKTGDGSVSTSEKLSSFARSMSLSIFGDKPKATFALEDAVANFHPRMYHPWEIVPDQQNRYRGYIQSSYVPSAAKKISVGLFISHEHASIVCQQLSPVVWLDETAENNRSCRLCRSSFALLRRVHHCRNCGACVCSE